MSNSDIRAAFETRIAEFAATLPYRLDLAWENAIYTPRIDRPYLRCFMIPAKTSNPALGAQFSRLLGLYQVNVYGLQNKGAGASDELADAIIALFPRGSITQNGVVVNIDVTGSRAQGLNDEDGFYFIPVRIQYRQDVISQN